MGMAETGIVIGWCWTNAMTPCPYWTLELHLIVHIPSPGSGEQKGGVLKLPFSAVPLHSAGNKFNITEEPSC